MDEFLSDLYRLATDYFAVLIVLYWLALVQPKKFLLYIAIALACICIISFIGYPEFYLGWARRFLDLFNLLPSIQSAGVAEDSLPEIQEAFVRGFYLALALVASPLILWLPIQKLGAIDHA